MGKIKEAQEILISLGLPPEQYNVRSALTLLSLADIKEDDDWSSAKPARRRIHDILNFIDDKYNVRYAENTRETIRRQVIHQFEQARIVNKNPDDPTLPTNSPRTNYCLSDIALEVVRSYGTKRWEAAIEKYKGISPTLMEIYSRKRKRHMIPVTLSNGEKIRLSPGEHNQLQADVIEKFAPIFAPASILVYLGDTAKKNLVVDKKLLKKLGVPVSKHDKLPDVVLFDKKRKRLFLIEAVTSHGPVSPKRQFELEEMLQECKTEKIYVSAFPDFTEFKKHISDIAWETEVWLSDIPDHLIHFNGDKFLD